MDVETKIVYEKSDGEISSDPEAVEYNPLERPSFFHQQKVNDQISQNSDDDELSNESESSQTEDSDMEKHDRPPKRAKLKPKNMMYANKKHNKYHVWNKRAQEDLLTETMNSCDVTKFDRSRDVETYNYPQRNNLKRTFKDRSNVHLRLGKRNEDEEEKRGAPRHLLDLGVSIDNADDEVATDISNKLYEEKDDILKRLISFVGKAKAIELYNETKRIEADGGMLIMNQTRRRTPGGIYFFLIKRDDVITEDQKREIFKEDKAKLNRERKKVRKLRAKAVNKDKTNLPNLLTRAEIEISKGNRTRKDSDHTVENVSNPPPSPVTDGRENSSDEMTDNIESSTVFTTTQNNTSSDRNLQAYDDDFLEIGCAGDMEFFS